LQVVSDFGKRYANRSGSGICRKLSELAPSGE
jgi:hypothetical protein